MPLLKLFLVGFSINLLYEIGHSFLYETCRKASRRQYAYLMLKGAFFDGFVIASGYWIAAGNLALFSLLMLLIAYVWEIYSLGKKKWEYRKTMPLFFGVGITPLVQLAITGLLSLYIANLI